MFCPSYLHKLFQESIPIDQFSTSQKAVHNVGSPNFNNKNTTDMAQILLQGMFCNITKIHYIWIVYFNSGYTSHLAHTAYCNDVTAS